MGLPAAKQGDKVMAVDTHIVVMPAPAPPVALPHPFAGVLQGNLSSDVNIMGKAAAVEGSTAENQPQHVPQGSGFQKAPSNQGTVKKGSATVNINGKPAARAGDPAMTCNDPADAPVGIVVVPVSTVMIG